MTLKHPPQRPKRPDNAPKMGDPAPAFELATRDGKQRVALADFAGRPLVLVFGSYT